MRFAWTILALVVLVSSASAADKLIDRPNDAAIEKATEQVKDIFGNDVAAAKTPAQKSALAKKILDTANGTIGDEAGRLVLLRAAKKLAIHAGDKKAAIAAVDAIVERYQAEEKLSAGEWLAKGDRAAKEAGVRKGERKLAVQVEAVEDYLRAKQVSGGMGLVGVAAAKKVEEMEEENTPQNEGWLVVFRSKDPSIWNCDVSEGHNHFAIALNKVPDDIRYLRIKNDHGQYVVIEISKNRLCEQFESGQFGWNGNKFHKYNGYQLGLYNKKWNRHATGDITTRTCNAGCYSGWGFGPRTDLDDKQGYCWAGREVPPTVFEISVRTTSLSRNELKFLLK